MPITNGKGEKTLILAHGAGAGMESEFLTVHAKGIARGGIRVIRFNFPYMKMMAETGKRRPPNSRKILIAAYRQVLESIRGPGIIGGKSMGGRIASLIADESNACGLLCLGYPFHPVRKPEKLRTAHLQTMKTKALILQGERDPFGNPIEVKQYGLSNKIDVQWLTDGDHSFKPRKASGRTQLENWQESISSAIQFIHQIS